MSCPFKIISYCNSKIFMWWFGSNYITIYSIWCWLIAKWQLLDELKCKLEDVFQINRLLRSCCNCCSSKGDFMCLKHFVSSAKRKASLLLIEQGKSFINMIKESGLRMLPWGTPDSTGNRSEWQLLMETSTKVGLKPKPQAARNVKVIKFWQLKLNWMPC